MIEKILNFIRTEALKFKCEPTSLLTIHCPCKKGIEFNFSYVGDPQLFDYLLAHIPHGSLFLEVEGVERWIEIPKFDGRPVEPSAVSISNQTVRAEIDGVREKFCKWLKLEDNKIIDAVFGCIAANLQEGDPVSVHVVGPPSYAKTEILRSTFSCPKVYALSSLTPQTFISGLKEKDKVKNSLLQTLTGRGKVVIVIKDFTTVLEMRNESRQEILSQLREIADGDYRKAFGTGKEVVWTGKLGMITGVTPVIDQHHSVRQVLGERFLNYRLPQNDPKAIAERALKVAGHEKEMRNELAEATRAFFEKLKGRNICIGSAIEDKLISLSSFVAVGRTAVSRDRYTQAVNYLPEAEGPPRLMKQLSTLGRGIALVQGKGEVDEGVYNILKKVGRDTLPSYRNLIFGEMWMKGIKGDRWEKLRALGELFKSPVATIRLYLEDLMMLGLVERKVEGEQRSYSDSDKVPYLWRLSENCCDLIQGSGVYERGENGAS